jgi:hypothetical protein
MKVLLIFVDADHAADVQRLLEVSNVAGYSEFPNVLGKGMAGIKRGNRAFPGTSTLYFVALPEGDCAGLCDGLRKLRGTKGPEEGLKAYIMDTTEVL